jgi:hypothetical protein
VRLYSALGFGAWLMWAGAVIAHYYARPDELLVFTDVPLRHVPYWREAAVANVRAVAGAALVVLAAWGIGSWVTRRLTERPLAVGGARASSADSRHTAHGAPLHLEPPERLSITLAFGFAALGLAFFALALLDLYRPAGTMAIVIAASAGGVVVLVRGGIRLPRLPTPPPRDYLFAGCAALAVGGAFIGALAPESEYDALWYHLWLPVRWLEAGRPVDIIEEYVSLYPLTWQLSGGAAMVVGGPVAAKLLHFAVLPLLGVSTFLLTRRLFPRASPMLGAALAVATPITIWEGTTAYVDLALAWYLSVSVYALVRYHESGDRRWLFISAGVMSAALAVKHLALVALPIVTCVLASGEWYRSGCLRHAAAVTMLFVCVTLVLPAPWYLRAYAASGNPVFPDLYGLFGAAPPERWSPVTERGLQAFKDRFGRPRTAGNLLLLPWDATVHAARYGGTPGPLFLILVPAALVGPGVRRRTGVVAAGCAAYVAIWASPISSFQMRFLLPLVPLLAALGAEGAARVERAAQRTWRGGPALVAALLTVLLLFNLPPTSGWHEPHRHEHMGWMTHIVRALPAGVVLGAESRQDYLARTVPSYRAWRFIDTTLPHDVRILTFSGGDHLYSTRPRIWSDSTRARPATWGTAAGDEQTAFDAIRRLGITHVLFDKHLIEQGGVDRLAIASDAMFRCCLLREYEDPHFVLYRVDAEGDPGAGVGSDVASPPSPSATAFYVCGTWNGPSMRLPGSTCRVVLPTHHALFAALAAS